MERSHVYIGCETGILKGVRLPGGTFTNISTDPSSLVNKDRAVDVVFYDKSDSSNTKSERVRLGLRNHDIVILNVENPSEDFSRVHVDSGEGKFVGGAMINKNTITCTESGDIFMNEGMQKSKRIAFAGKDVCRMIQGQNTAETFISGGRENHLKVWNLLSPKEPIFTAKNKPDDKLRLRVPTWTNDIRVRPKSDDKVILVASAYHNIEVYDVRTRRRPVMTVQYLEDPLTCLDVNPFNEFEVLVGNRLGKVALFDLRGTKGIQLKSYPGNHGTTKQIRFHPSQAGYFATLSLDRYMRIYDVKQKSAVNEVYLKSQPTCIMFTDEPIKCWSKEDKMEEPVDRPPKKKRVAVDEIIDTDEVWKDMALATEETPEKLVEYKKQGRKVI